MTAVSKHIYIALLITAATLLCGCASVSADGTSALDALPALVARAEVINEMVWGGGAPAEAYEQTGVTTTVARYVKVLPTSPFTTARELSAEIGAVFSQSYAEMIRQLALEGSDDQSPRYNQSEDGLTVNVNHKGYTLRTKLDTSSARIVSRGFDRVRLAVPCTFDGEPDGDYEVTLVLEGGMWKLDSPTY